MARDATAREVVRTVKAHRQVEGGGFVVRRPFPALGLDAVDPFLLLDEMGPADYAPGEALGAPDHPHRGFETVTLLLEGEMEHEDSAGHRGKLTAGDVQWMTAGRGVVHSEMPSRRLLEQGGRLHGFQIWVNLPAREKRTEPRYQELPKGGIPEAATPDGRARGRILAGEALGVSARIQTRTPIVLQDWTITPGGRIELPIGHDYQVCAYVFGGAVRLGSQERQVSDGELAVFGDGATFVAQVDADAAKPARLLLLAGVPLKERVVRYGPFVMNSVEEIREAIEDFQSGRLGEIAR